MRKLIMWNHMSLDGFFEGVRSWDLDWMHSFWDEEMKRHSIEQLRTTEVLVFGRVTYEGMAAYWQTAQGEDAEFMNKLPKVVFSRTLERADWANTRLMRDNVVATIQELKRAGEGNMFVFGSADLSASLAQDGLFDEFRVAVAPIILGRGKTLFGRDLSQLTMKLIDVRQLSNGYIIVRYCPVPAANRKSAEKESAEKKSA